MQALIIHPTAAYLYRGKPRAATIKVIAPKQAKGPTVADLKVMLAQRGIKTMARHTKAELQAMMVSGQFVRPAAQDAVNAKRRKVKPQA